MSIPKKRIVIDKDHGITTESIPRKIERDRIFTQKGRSKGVMKFLAKRSQIRRRKLTQREKDKKFHQPRKHLKSKGSNFNFRRIETLVKNKNSV